MRNNSATYDNTLSATNSEIGTLRKTLENDANILTTSVELTLLITKHGNETSIKIGNGIIQDSKSLKGLIIT